MLGFVKHHIFNQFNNYQFFDRSAFQQAKHDYKNVFQKSKKDLAAISKSPLSEATMLVIGCGYNYSNVILYANIVKHIVGLDLIKTYYRDGLIDTFKDLRKRGSNWLIALFEASLLRYKYYKYYHYLKIISNRSIKHRKYNLLSYDGYRIPFKNETFDIVISNAVVEHVKNLEKLIKQTYKITKKYGVAYHLWHNYYSFSGGHIPEALCFKHPWGHLRGKYKTNRLNKLTPNEVKRRFEKYFDIIYLYQIDKYNRKKGIDNDFEFEQEKLLTKKIRKELQDFPLDLLLTRAYLIIGMKK